MGRRIIIDSKSLFRIIENLYNPEIFTIFFLPNFKVEQANLFDLLLFYC